MTADIYLQTILNREAVDVGLNSPVRAVQQVVAPVLNRWAGSYLRWVSPSGSFAKGTANRSGTDIDLFISLTPQTPNTLKGIYDTLFEALKGAGYTPKRQNVSINVRVGAYDVDLVPAKRQTDTTEDHSLYRSRADTWTKTNVTQHVNYVSASGRQREIRLLKLWRLQKGIVFPSFYLELATINALWGRNDTLPNNVWVAFQYFRDHLATARIVDPANSNNVISDDLTVAEKNAVKASATAALGASRWEQIVR